MDMFLAWADVRRGGDGTAAADRFTRAKAMVDGSGTHITEIDFSSMFAEVLLAANRAGDVFAIAESALRITREGEVRHLEPELLRLQGDAAKALGALDRARALYHQALEGARAAGASLLERRASSALGLIENRS